MSDAHATSPRIPGNYWVIIIAAVLFFLSSIVLAVAAYFIFYHPTATTVAPSAVTDQGAMLGALGKLVDLPRDEKPQVVTVTDVESIKKQTFFARAESGNVLVLYIRNHLAVLYNPKENKIVNLSKITAVVIPPPAL